MKYKKKEKNDITSIKNIYLFLVCSVWFSGLFKKYVYVNI